MTKRGARTINRYGPYHNKGYGWANWFIGRGRLHVNFSARDLRMISWRH